MSKIPSVYSFCQLYGNYMAVSYIVFFFLPGSLYIFMNVIFYYSILKVQFGSTNHLIDQLKNYFGKLKKYGEQNIIS